MCQKGGREGGGLKGGGGGVGWDPPPPRVTTQKMGEILFFLPKAPMAPKKKTKICGTSAPAKICP